MLKAIETIYNGYKFRSRLEARYAVFFDALDVPYDYEPQGYETAAGRYLPDFWLPHQQCWIEVKPEAPTEIEAAKMNGLVEQTRGRGYICFGPLWIPDGRSASAHLHEWTETDGSMGLSWDSHHWWCECPTCGAVGLEYEGRAGRIPCACQGKDEGDINRESPRLIAAYTAARQARFEHGQTPRVPR